jgi:hypothetical protein
MSRARQRTYPVTSRAIAHDDGHCRPEVAQLLSRGAPTSEHLMTVLQRSVGNRVARELLSTTVPARPHGVQRRNRCRCTARPPLTTTADDRTGRPNRSNAPTTAPTARPIDLDCENQETLQWPVALSFPNGIFVLGSTVRTRANDAPSLRTDWVWRKPEAILVSAQGRVVDGPGGMVSRH